jgi:7-carboxy-7-deazaguanine synthase (Cx14CxxC type)
MYAVKEIFYTLQGEGANTGRPAVFCRFAGCNLWTGREEDRNRAVCQFCDTDFVGTDGPGGGKFETAEELAAAIGHAWSSEPSRRAAETPSRSSAETPSRFVVCTGGEPLLQLDEELIEALHRRGFEIAVETNGTVPPPEGIDWLCLSPKARADLVVTSGDELKLVYPQDGGEPERYRDLDFRHFFLQPMDGPDLARNTRAAVAYCLAHPDWRLSLQTHKLLGIP